LRRALILTVLVVVLLSIQANGQSRLVFELAASHDSVVVESGDLVNIQYRGYLNQVQLNKSHVAAVANGSLFLLNGGKDLPAQPFEIKGEDITGFRRMSPIQPFIKPLGSLAASIGMLYLLDSSDNISLGSQILYTTLAGIAVNYLLDLLFPDDIKYHMADGWKVRSGN
jgi:hypothetical protein